MTKIVNHTPWNTEDLEKMILPMVTGCGLSVIQVGLIAHNVGRWRAKETLGRVKFANQKLGHDKQDEAWIEILSPKRAAARAEALDRLSLCESLGTHETMLPLSVIATLEHSFEKIYEAKSQAKRGPGSVLHRNETWGLHDHFSGHCECAPESPKVPIVVRGDVKAKTQDRQAPKVADLEERAKHTKSLQEKFARRAEYARQDAEKNEEKASGYATKVARIEERIRKLKAAEAMNSLGIQHLEEEDDDGDEDQQEAE